MASFQVHPYDGVGSEIHGVDIAKGISDDEFTEIQNIFVEHGLIFFRDQNISEEQHIEFAERWGEINVNRFFTAHEKFPKIAMVAKEPHHQKNIGEIWHTDHSYDLEPALGSILVARELPPVGGDTWFTSMYKAYAGLSDGLKQTLAGMRAVHSAHHAFGSGSRDHLENDDIGDRLGNQKVADALENSSHPVIITHPLSGKKVLYVNPTFTIHFEGWTQEESAPLLQYLYRFAVTESFVTKFKWQPGSIAFWDNRATWHSAQNDYQGHRRVMHRITLEGCALQG